MAEPESRSEPNRPRRSIRMDADEAWAFVAQAHTGIFTTLRRDGFPVALPVWFVALDRRIYIGTRGKKLLRARHDPRCSFLVEEGDRWAELRAVHLVCRAEIIEPSAELAGRIRAEMNRKYSAFRTSPKAMPRATREHYEQSMGATIELVPDERILTWDNRKLGLA